MDIGSHVLDGQAGLPYAQGITAGGDQDVVPALAATKPTAPWEADVQARARRRTDTALHSSSRTNGAPSRYMDSLLPVEGGSALRRRVAGNSSDPLQLLFITVPMTGIMTAIVTAAPPRRSPASSHASTVSRHHELRSLSSVTSTKGSRRSGERSGGRRHLGPGEQRRQFGQRGDDRTGPTRHRVAVLHRADHPHAAATAPPSSPSAPSPTK